MKEEKLGTFWAIYPTVVLVNWVFARVGVLTHPNSHMAQNPGHLQGALVTGLVWKNEDPTTAECAETSRNEIAFHAPKNQKPHKTPKQNTTEKESKAPGFHLFIHGPYKVKWPHSAHGFPRWRILPTKETHSLVPKPNAKFLDKVESGSAEYGGQAFDGGVF